MSIKITFSPTDGRLYGAQIVGYDGVDKRIDQYALFIKKGGTTEELTLLEQAYAPPYSSAKDPVAITGYIAGNILSGKMTPLYWRELSETDISRITLVDVRTREEFELGTIPGAINIPLEELRERMKELPMERPVYLFCSVGLRGYLASNILKGNGYRDVRNLIGGLKTYDTSTMQLLPATTPDNNKAGENQAPHSCQATTIKVDACGIQCPGPILKLKKTIETIKAGERIEISATDSGFPRDAEAWCHTTGNIFIDKHSENGIHHVVIEKSNTEARETDNVNKEDKGKTLILFSDDLDKAIATFVLANGAAATGKKVSIFFTFWGLNAIKKAKKPKVKKDVFGKMFGWALPSDSTKLSLSKMSMMGFGAKIMRYLMRKKNAASLEELRVQAIENGVEFIACQMSMDVMGIDRDELLDNVVVGGVATYMDRAEQANVNLFI